MFDLDKAIYTYLWPLNDKRCISRDALDEIEGHLRDKLEFYLAAGIAEEDAVKKAIQDLGTAESLLGEFSAVFHNNKRGQIANILSYYFDRRVVMRLLIGFSLGIFFILAGLALEGGHIAALIQPTAFVIVVGGALGALFITYPVTTVKESWVLAFTGRQAVRSKYLDASNVFKSFGDLAVLTSFVGLIFGVIHVLSQLSSIDRIGAGCAVAIVSLLYGVMVKLFIGRALSDSFKLRAFPSVEQIKNHTSKKDIDLSAA